VARPAKAVRNVGNLAVMRILYFNVAR